MRKFIFSFAVLLLATSVLASGNAKMQTTERSVTSSTDTTTAQKNGRKIVDGMLETVDSIGAAVERAANHPISQRIVDGAEETFDSISAASQRFGKKAKVWGDSISARTRRAWNSR